MNTDRDELAAELRRLREVSGRSLKDLEADLHVSDSSLSRYLSGKTVPPWSVVSALSRVAGREPDRLRPLWTAARNAPERPEGLPGTSEERIRPPRRRWSVPLVSLLLGALIGSVMTLTLKALTNSGGHSSGKGTSGPHFSVTLLEASSSRTAAIWSFNARCGNADEYRLVYDLPTPVQRRATAYRLDHADCTTKLFDGIGGSGVGEPLANDHAVHPVPPELARRGSSIVAYSCCNGTVLPARK